MPLIHIIDSPYIFTIEMLSFLQRIEHRKFDKSFLFLLDDVDDGESGDKNTSLNGQS